MFPDTAMAFWATFRDWERIFLPQFGKLIDMAGKKSNIFTKKMADKGRSK
jgi:hypothetical protein